MMVFKVIGILCLIAVAKAGPDGTRGSRNVIQTESNLLDSVYQDCLKKDTLSCLKYKVFSFADKIVGLNEITIASGVKIIKSGEPDGAPRALPGDASIESVLLSKVQRFLETHTIKFDVSGKDIVTAIGNTARSLSETEEDEDDEEESFDEARGKIKKKKKFKKMKHFLGPLFKIIALKKLFLMKLALLGIGLIAGQALLSGTIALIISGFIGIKKILLSLKGGQGHPIHTESHVFAHESIHPIEHGHGYADHSAGHGGWGRSIDGQQLAYRGHAQ